ncbi:hypothetical protein BDK51DRAFT_39493 [Blyttiomyces helicus]|uniref:Uncharacterized protein n=1 Tax=Blyttiomyces helicus TaxID=388810 RepID=A0A4P9WN19_9FUNG|nr:hypothetical protein BDK51DRAFT_39493 [Blyttiomyces helicus]|eukprot:RKO92146.1 hypothetical protein BDK51DRAFT_39493 [Blyttiomyces helicus]
MAADVMAECYVNLIPSRSIWTIQRQRTVALQAYIEGESPTLANTVHSAVLSADPAPVIRTSLDWLSVWNADLPLLSRLPTGTAMAVSGLSTGVSRVASRPLDPGGGRCCPGREEAWKVAQEGESAGTSKVSEEAEYCRAIRVAEEANHTATTKASQAAEGTDTNQAKSSNRATATDKLPKQRFAKPAMPLRVLKSAVIVVDSDGGADHPILKVPKGKPPALDKIKNFQLRSIHLECPGSSELMQSGTLRIGVVRDAPNWCNQGRSDLGALKSSVEAEKLRSAFVAMASAECQALKVSTAPGTSGTGHLAPKHPKDFKPAVKHLFPVKGLSDLDNHLQTISKKQKADATALAAPAKAAKAPSGPSNSESEAAGSKHTPVSWKKLSLKQCFEEEDVWPFVAATKKVKALLGEYADDEEDKGDEEDDHQQYLSKYTESNKERESKGRDEGKGGNDACHPGDWVEASAGGEGGTNMEEIWGFADNFEDPSLREENRLQSNKVGSRERLLDMIAPRDGSNVNHFTSKCSHTDLESSIGSLIKGNLRRVITEVPVWTKVRHEWDVDDSAPSSRSESVWLTGTSRPSSATASLCSKWQGCPLEGNTCSKARLSPSSATSRTIPTKSKMKGF